ncbi:MAG: PD40 domain-containing protein [Anaerolineaceae bacterium]|nr:PD40 domain-containing protein [Anaerolineaceae bacterium]
MRRSKATLSVVVIFISLFLFVDSSIAVSGDIIQVSVSSEGIQANAYSYAPKISSDGRYISFSSEADNLVLVDENEVTDIFVHDCQTGGTELVSIASDGTQGNGHSWFSAISGDGRFIVFDSDANNLVVGDTNDATDIFVHDRQTGMTIIVSVSSEGTQGIGNSVHPAISENGRFVAFSSEANNLVTNDTNADMDVFVHDLVTRETEKVSIASDGTQGVWGSGSPALSGDGQFIVFQSINKYLVVDDTNETQDIFIHDRSSSETMLASISSDGSQANFISMSPAISANGRYVAFESGADNLTTSDTNEKWDIFIHDMLTGDTSLISVASDETQANQDSRKATLSSDGRYIAFTSDADNLVEEDLNNFTDVFIHDIQYGFTSLVSISFDGTQANNYNYSPAISANGRYLAFYSYAFNLVPVDTNGTADIFVKSLPPHPNHYYLPLITY